MRKNRYTLCILAAGTLWGLMGLFVRALEREGVSPTGAVLLRCGLAALLFGALIALRDRSLFAVRLRDWWCFFGCGVCALLFFTYCYFRSMDYLDLSTAAILLYTAPSIVIVLSRVFFGEKLSRVKLCALALAFAGCCLVSSPGGSVSLSFRGLALGLGAGLGYALYSVFARVILNRGYASLTVNFYSCLLAGAGAGLIWGFGELGMAARDGRLALLSLATAAVTCFLPYLLYTYGLSGMETGKASILASLEPVVATLAGVLVFHETLSARSLCGMALVLVAIALLGTGGGNKAGADGAGAGNKTDVGTNKKQSRCL